MDERNPLKMKVTELKVELGKRGLSQTGLKFDLAQRLQTAMDEDEFGAISSSLPCLSNTPASFLSTASAAKAENQATSPDVCRAPNINTEARDPRGSSFTASVSSREVSAPVPRRAVARDFSSDPLPKRAKRSRVIASSSGLGGAPVKRKKLQKDQSTGGIGIKRDKEEMSKNFEKLGLQPYEYEVFQRKLGGVSEPSATVKTVGHHPEHWKNIARGCSIKEAERKTAEQTAKMIERQKRFSSQDDWVRPKP